MSDEEVLDDPLAEEGEETENDDVIVPDEALIGEEKDDTDTDFAVSATSTSFADDVGDDEEDPHEAAFNSASKKDDSQLDPYGVGAPSGFDDEEDDYLGDDEEDELIEEDSNAF